MKTNPESIAIKTHAAQAARMLKALANPERLLILCDLLAGEHKMGDLWQKSKLSQSAFSQHLAVLRRDGLVQTRKEAQTVFYSLADKRVVKILELLQQLYCEV